MLFFLADIERLFQENPVEVMRLMHTPRLPDDPGAVVSLLFSEMDMKG